MSLATVPTYLKLVGPDRYGVLAIAWLLLGYFGLFELGLGRATSFRIAALRDAPPQARANTFWAALATNIMIGAIGGCIMWICAGYFFAHVFKVNESLRAEILQGVPLLAAAVPMATLTGVAFGALQGREKFLETNAISVVSTAAFQLIPLTIAFAFGPKLVWLLCGALSARLLAFLLIAYRCHIEITRGTRRQLDTKEIPLLLKYGGWVAGVSLLGPLLLITDRFVIGAVLGAAAVAAYTIPFQFAQRIPVLPASLMNALFPKMSGASHAEFEAMAENAMRTLAAVMTPLVLGALFALAPFFDIWIGKTMSAQAAPLGRVLLIGFWANGFALVSFTRLQASGRPDLVTKILLIEIPPYWLCLWLGMTYLGTLGSALAFSGRMVLDYFLLTRAAGGRAFRTLPVLAANFCLLLGAAWLGSIFSLREPGWWLSAAALMGAALWLSWRILPTEFHNRLTQHASRLHPNVGRFMHRFARLEARKTN
jgi:O-antigen/teichoic acid export membrane protein